MSLFDRAEHAVSLLPTPVRRRANRVGYHFLRGWWLLRRPSTHGVKVVVRRDDDVLLVRHAYGRRLAWDLPGGFISEGEDPNDAARRELAEELGLRAQTLVGLGTVLMRWDGKRDTVHGFATDVDGDPIELDRAEIDSARWFAHRELPEETSPYTRRMVARAYWELFRG